MPVRSLILEKIALFSSLPAATKEEIAAQCGLQRFGAGSVLFLEGDRPEFAYAIAEGSAALVTGNTGAEAVIEFFRAGDVILIPAVVLDLPYLLTARAMEDGQLLLIPAQTFRDILDRDGAFAAAAARLLARHWRLVIGQLKDVRTLDATERVVRYLVMQCGRREGRVSIPLPGLQRNLASRLDMTPESLSRILRQLRAAGVSVRDGRIEVADIAALARRLPRGGRDPAPS